MKVTRPTKWTVLRYIGDCEDPQKAVRSMRDTFPHQDEGRISWDDGLSLVIMELWYAYTPPGQEYRRMVIDSEPKTIKELMEQMRVQT